MKQFYFLSLSLFFLSTAMVAQEEKWSVEANFPISVGEDLGNDVSGVIDVGLKYRFLDFSFVKIGAGINAGYFKGNVNSFTDPVLYDYDETNWLIQPKLFAEFSIPSVSKLHPSLGLGYSIIESKNEGLFGDESINISDASGGLNVNLGLSYDISKKFFIQAQYDYIHNKIESDNFDITVKENLGYLKLGVGLRF